MRTQLWDRMAQHLKDVHFPLARTWRKYVSWGCATGQGAWCIQDMEETSRDEGERAGRAWRVRSQRGRQGPVYRGQDGPQSEFSFFTPRIIESHWILVHGATKWSDLYVQHIVPASLWSRGGLERLIFRHAGGRWQLDSGNGSGDRKVQ